MHAEKDNTAGKYVKILFKFYSDLLEEDTKESLWATVIDELRGIYQIDNIPFYIPSIAYGDLVFASYDKDEGMLVYQYCLEYSGNSTIQVVLMNKNFATNTIRDIFNAMQCESEKFAEGYFVIDVPAAIDYKPVKQKLEQLKNEGIIDYAEPCIAENHNYIN